MENPFEEENGFSFGDYLDNQAPTEEIITHVHRQTNNSEPVSNIFQEPTIYSINFSSPILENDEQLNNYDNQVKDLDQNPEINNNDNISTMPVDDRYRKTKDLVNFDETKEACIKKDENFIKSQENLNDSKSAEIVIDSENVEDLTKKIMIDENITSDITENCKKFLLDNKDVLRLFNIEVKENEENKEIIPLEKESTETVYGLFNRGTKGNNEIIFIKKESIRIMLIRGHNRWIKSIFNSHIECKNLSDMNFIDLKNKLRMKYYDVASQYINKTLNKDIFKSICSPDNNPTCKKQKVSETQAKKHKSFTDNYCKEYFSIPEILRSFNLYVDFLLKDGNSDEYCKRLNINCCLSKLNNTHEDDCEKKWEILRQFLKLGLLALSTHDFKNVIKNI